MAARALPPALFSILAASLVAGACYIGPGEGPGIDAATEASSGTSEGSSGGAGSTASSTSGGTGTSAGTSGSASATSSASATTTGDPTTSAATSDPTTGTSGDATTDAGTTGIDPTTTTTTTSTSTSTTGDPTTGGDPNDVCARWNGDRQELSEGAWSGDAAGCVAGDVAAPGRANALKLINLYRWLADLPPVADDPTRNTKSQSCALMMQANGQLSHSPPMNWKCYAADGAEAAGKSNIAGAAGVSAIDLYMADPGNATTFGHRRWILSNGLGPVGLGSTSGYSCLWVIGGNGNGGNEYTAWPSPGEFPIEAMTASWKSVDETGWTIQSSAIDLKAAQVTITVDGQAKPVTVSQLLPNYGSTQAIAIVPQGWTSQAGKTYSVAVSGTNPPIAYDVSFVACP